MVNLINVLSFNPPFMTYLLSIAGEALKNHSYDWLFAASLPPIVYLLLKKRKQGWLKRLFIKWAIKRARKQANKKGRMSDGAAILLIILGVLGLGALLVWLLGWGWTIVIILLILLLTTVRRNREDEG